MWNLARFVGGQDGAVVQCGIEHSLQCVILCLRAVAVDNLNGAQNL